MLGDAEFQARHDAVRRGENPDQEDQPDEREGEEQ